MDGLMYFLGTRDEIRKKAGFGLLCIGLLWALAGGQIENFGSRILFIAPLYFLFTWKEWGNNRELLLSPKSLVWGLIFGLSAALIPGILIYWASGQSAVSTVIFSGGPLAWSQDLLAQVSTFTLLDIFVLGLFWTPLWALFSRACLQKDWGLWSLCFVDSLILGIGSQSAGVFFGSLVVGLAGAFVFQKRDLGQAVWTQSFAVLSLGLTLWMLAPRL